MTEYPGVLHQFDGREGPPWTDPTAPTTRNCHRVERDGALVNAATDACVEYGPGGGYDEAAVASAQAALTALLTEIFDLSPR